MAVPGFQNFMLPIVQFCLDGKEHSIHEIVEEMRVLFKISHEDAQINIPSGQQSVLLNRIFWARTYLIKAGLLVLTRRSYCQITDRGKHVLKQNPKTIDIKFLSQFPEFREFKRRREPPAASVNPQPLIHDQSTPDERIDEAYQEIRDSLAQQLLAAIFKCPPEFFEKLVVELLVKMGYGGSRRDAAKAVGQSGDGGIDGIIDEDRLGLDTIYIQAKRWEGPVGRPEIQKFVGALMGKRSRKGIFITTSTFSQDAQQYVKEIDYRIVLIDGKRIAEYMMDYGIGVAEERVYQIKRIDSDYFAVA